MLNLRLLLNLWSKCRIVTLAVSLNTSYRVLEDVWVGVDLSLRDSEHPHIVLRIVGRTVRKKDVGIVGPALSGGADEALLQTLDVIEATELTPQFDTALVDDGLAE